MGQPADTLLPELVAQGFFGVLDQVYATGQEFTNPELPMQLVDPASGQVSKRYLNVVYQVLCDEQGLISGLLAFATDITEQVEARRQVLDFNQELTVTNTYLARTNADLNTFVYSASHDLKAPITNIEGLLQALRHEPPPRCARQRAGAAAAGHDGRGRRALPADAGPPHRRLAPAPGLGRCP